MRFLADHIIHIWLSTYNILPVTIPNTNVNPILISKIYIIVGAPWTIFTRHLQALMDNQITISEAVLWISQSLSQWSSCIAGMPIYHRGAWSSYWLSSFWPIVASFHRWLGEKVEGCSSTTAVDNGFWMAGSTFPTSCYKPSKSWLHDSESLCPCTYDIAWGTLVRPWLWLS
jgi:hypothetical protein